MNVNKAENEKSAEWPAVVRLKNLRKKMLTDLGIVTLSVLVNRETITALQQVCRRNDISLTEGIRRAISVAHLLYSEASSGRKIVVTDRKGHVEREVILL